MVSFVTRMYGGFPGRVSRSDSLTIEPSVIDTSAPPTVYGSFVKLVSGKLQAIGAGDASATVWGILVNAFPVQSTTTALGAATPPTSGVIDVLRRGYITVALKLGTAAKGGQVYVVTTAGGSVAAGDIVTSASPAGGGTGTAVTGCFFEGPADANGNVEVAFAI